ncbi:MAG: hypothetical protein QXP35_01495, partial [Candidatus Micrarchaeaceae archaeon]
MVYAETCKRRKENKGLWKSYKEIRERNMIVMLAKVNENSSLPKDASFEKKVEAIDKGIPVYIGSEEEYTAIVKELLKRHKLKLDPEKDYEIYLSIDNDKRVAICLIIDVKTG